MVKRHTTGKNFDNHSEVCQLYFLTILKLLTIISPYNCTLLLSKVAIPFIFNVACPWNIFTTGDKLYWNDEIHWLTSKNKILKKYSIGIHWLAGIGWLILQYT